jgi:hypothetical protein
MFAPPPSQDLPLRGEVSNLGGRLQCKHVSQPHRVRNLLLCRRKSVGEGRAMLNAVRVLSHAFVGGVSVTAPPERVGSEVDDLRSV